MQFFSDPALRSRQDQLNAQWHSLESTYYTSCDDGLGFGAVAEFAIDLQNWDAFYSSESDWTTASKHATDEWQTKLQEWTKRFKNLNCGAPSQIPGVKEVPPDEKGFLDDLADTAKSGAKWAAGLTALGLILGAAVVITIFYFIFKSNVSLSKAST